MAINEREKQETTDTKYSDVSVVVSYDVHELQREIEWIQVGDVWIAPAEDGKKFEKKST
jgi:hypothetical protein